jgi:hypothetical protein
MKRITVFVLPLALLSLLFAQWEIALGLLLGGTGALIHLRLVVLDVNRLTTYRHPAQAAKAARRGYAKRFLLLGLIMVVPFFNPWFSFPATVIGLLSIKVAIYLGELITYLNRHSEGGGNSVND